MAWTDYKRKEKYVGVRKSRTGRIENKEWAFAAAGYLPLSPSILKEFEKDIKDEYHVTDIKSYPKLKQIQGRRVDIAAFTKASFGVVKGLLTDGELLVTLNGKTSIIFEGDVNTIMDRNGVRWLKTSGSVSTKVNDIVYEFANDISERVIEKFDVDIEDFTGRRSALPNDVAVHNWIWNQPGGIKRQFLNYYYAEAKKLVNKPLIDKINKALGWRDNQNISHNEILLHNFKIVKTRMIRSEDPDKAVKMWGRAEEAKLTHLDIIEEGEIHSL